MSEAVGRREMKGGEGFGQPQDENERGLLGSYLV